MNITALKQLLLAQLPWNRKGGETSAPVVGHKFDFLVLFPALVAGWLGFLKFNAASLLDLDEYYHMAVTRMLLSGHFPHSLPFKFSMLGDFYADKDLLMHLLALPFLLLVKDPVIAAKCTAVLMDTALVLTLCAIMNRYAGKTAAAVLTLGLLTSPLFIMYSLYMRPATMAILFTVAGLHFMVQKNKWPLFFIALFFALAHVSAFTLLFFALLCEGLRWLYYREFNTDIVAYTLLGIVAGCIIHPNFPMNVATVYVNAILAPLYAKSGEIHSFGSELFAGTTNYVLYANALVFGFFSLTLWLTFALRPKISLSTIFFALVAQLYFVLGMGSMRFWHQVLPITLLAASSFWGDLRNMELTPPLKKILKTAGWLWLAATCLLIAATGRDMGDKIKARVKFIIPIADAAQWLHGELPPGTVVYHSLWSDSHPLLLFAPEYVYMTALDPVYMMYIKPKTASIYDKLGDGLLENPHEVITRLFQSRYAFTLKPLGFYNQVKNLPGFEVIYENSGVAIFHLTDLPEKKPPAPGRKK